MILKIVFVSFPINPTENYFPKHWEFFASGGRGCRGDLNEKAPEAVPCQTQPVLASFNTATAGHS